jgi:hypothetical protein
MTLPADLLLRLAIAAYAGLGLVLTARVLARAGVPRAWSLVLWAPAFLALFAATERWAFAFLPLAVLLAWLFAYARWPGHDSGAIAVTAWPRAGAAGADKARADKARPGTARPRHDDPELGPAPLLNGKSARWLLSGFDRDGRTLRFEIPEARLAAAPDGVVIGRQARMAEFVVPDAGVSRRHARLALDGRDLVIEDLGSANGTTVEGRRLTPHRRYRIERGVEIALGGVTLSLAHAL